MPFVEREGVRLYWREDGTPDRPPLLLLNSLGTDMSMWDAVVRELRDAFRILRMDTRGHGASGAASFETFIPDLAVDALAVLDDAGADKAHVAGVSMGGMTVLQLCETASERLLRAAACNTSSAMPEDPWYQRARTVREHGMAAIADMVMGRFFTARFRDREPAVVHAARAALLRQDPESYAACCMAIAGMDIADGLGAIRTPLLVVVGTEDESTPPEHGERIEAAVPGARLASLDTAHISALEDPAGLARLLRGFLLEQPGYTAADKARDDLFEAGLVPRRAVLGAAHVDRSLAARNPFTADFQAFITRYAWGEIWTRPGLDHRTRRLLVLATTMALGRWEEFRLHARAGIEQHGFSVDELKETIMQSAIYAGVPAANTGFHHASDVLKELGKLP